MTHRPLEVAYLIHQFPPEVGAGPARISELGRRWLEHNVSLTAITSMPNRPEGRIHDAYRGRLFQQENWEGIRALRSWLYASPRHGFARTLLNNATFLVTSTVHGLSRMGKCDVLIASSPPFFPHIGGWVLSVLRGLPLVLEVRDLWPDYLVEMGVLKRSAMATRLLFRVERALLKRASRVVVVTDSFKRRVIGKGVAAERVHVISNGVDPDQYYPDQEVPPVGCLEAGPDEFVVGYLGNIGAGQALGALVEAAVILAHEDSRIRMVIVGDGPDKQRLLDMIARLDLKNLYYSEPIPKHLTRAFYNNCDVNLVPLANIPVFQETVPSKIFEIMACERPVMASLAGEGAQIVEESGGGIVVAPEDPAAIAAGILRLAGMRREALEAMGKLGRAYVLQRYNRNTLAYQYLKVLEDVAQSSSTVAR